jgi:hypothetical protein
MKRLMTVSLGPNTTLCRLNVYPAKLSSTTRKFLLDVLRLVAEYIGVGCVTEEGFPNGDSRRVLDFFS